MNSITPEKERLQRILITQLGEAFASIQDPEKSRILLNLLLSPTEKERIGKRLAILKELRRDTSYSKIKESLKVSDNTIAQMSNALKQSSAKSLRLIDKLIKTDLLREGKGFEFSRGKK
ncbi:MAG: Trp family transcriptional regulator [Patescibacteria group bacterium]|nr:Trp family transcriptional regulator [Patescibacteria group bacterium]